MRVGVIGLGKMGYNLSLNLVKKNNEVVAYDKNEETRNKSRNSGIDIAESIKELCEKLNNKKIIWLMIPCGEIVDKCIEEIAEYLNPGDIIIDGGNSNYKDSIRRYEALKLKQINFLDCGTSGGTSGALSGACTMVGGDKDIFQYCESIFKDISVEGGYIHVGTVGSGHYVKMIHNGIEYGMMQAIAEGFEIMHESQFDLNLEEIAGVWNHGSVIRSWLMELTESALKKDKGLTSIKGVMHSSGEGKWTLEEALNLQVSAPVIALSLLMRYRSLNDDTFSGKVVAALRNEFGGHKVEKR